MRGATPMRVQRVREAEQRVAPGRDELAETVAVSLFKLMAIKDEYEVARLFTDGSFERQLRGEFSGWKRLEFHLAPPLFAKRDPTTGRLRKQTYGPWMMKAFRLLAMARRLRGSWLDPFGRSAERRMERRLLADYFAALDDIVARLRRPITRTPSRSRPTPRRSAGFGHVKAEAVQRAEAEATVRREAFLSSRPRIAVAAE